jgi:Uma2 family endonuclease
MAVELTRRRFTTADYHRMLETGIVREGDRVELIEGEIVEMAAMGARHMDVVSRFTHGFVREMGDHSIVRVQGPILLSDRSEPEPDLVVAVPRPGRYHRSHPTPEDILLVVEVSDSSLEYDRQIKLPLYARAEIPETWLADLNGGVVLVHREPSDGAYRVVHLAGRGERIARKAAA